MASVSIFQNETQKKIFEAVARAGNLIFACGPAGISANIYGEFRVERVNPNEDRLLVGDGTTHVHVDWGRVRQVDVSTFHGEGLLTFRDQNEVLFKIYRVAGPYDNVLQRLISQSTLRDRF